MKQGGWKGREALNPVRRNIYGQPIEEFETQTDNQVIPYDFDRSSELGPDWQSTYRGFGVGMMQSDGGPADWQTGIGHSIFVRFDYPAEFRVYGSLSDSDGNAVGAKVTADTVCANCGKRPASGDVLTAKLAPNMAGTWHHTDCDDPKLGGIHAIRPGAV